MKSKDFVFSGSKITADNDCSHEIRKENFDKLRQYSKMQRHHLAYKGMYSQGYSFFQ